MFCTGIFLKNEDCESAPHYVLLMQCMFPFTQSVFVNSTIQFHYIGSLSSLTHITGQYTYHFAQLQVVQASLLFKIAIFLVPHTLDQGTAFNGHAVAQLVEALRYKSEGHGFDSRWCHWNFSLTQSFRPYYGPGVDSASNRNEYQEYFLGQMRSVSRANNLTTFMCRQS